MPTLQTQLLWILGMAALMAVYAGVPLAPCPASCGEPDPQLIEYTRLPGVPRADKDKMLTWGRSFPCSLCKKRRWVTGLWYQQEFIEMMSHGTRCGLASQR